MCNCNKKKMTAMTSAQAEDLVKQTVEAPAKPQTQRPVKSVAAARPR